MRRIVPLYAFILAIAFGVASCAEKAATTGKHTLRVMTYNIHHANPPSKAKTGEIELDAIANVIRKNKPDLVALQEVDVNTGRSGPGNEAEMLAEKVGMHAYFGRAIDYDGGYYGVAILSRYPLSETAVLHLPEDADPAAEDRVLTTAKVTLPGGLAIRFGSTHIDVRNLENRDQQVRTVNEFAAKETLPFIVAGDFNSLPESTAIVELDKAFTRTCTSGCGFTIPVNAPKRTIDYIAFTKSSPFKVVSHKVIQEPYPSDHLPVIAILSY